MKLIGMMSFFDENEDQLQSCVRDLHDLGVKILIVVDGPYALYPHTQIHSSPSQIDALRRECSRLDIAMWLYQPSEAWAGNEVEKRQIMLDLALSVYETGDWLVIWDADYQLYSLPSLEMIFEALEDTTCDFAAVDFTDCLTDAGWHEMRMFMRAQPMSMGTNHHTYVLADGRRSQILSRPGMSTAGALDLREVRIRHRVADRDPERRARQTKYYERRDGGGIES